MHQSIVRTVNDLRRTSRCLEHFEEREALTANRAGLVADPEAEQCAGCASGIAPPAATAIVPTREEPGTDFRDFRDTTSGQEQEPESAVDVEIRRPLARSALDMPDDEFRYPGLEVHQLVEISAERSEPGLAHAPTDTRRQRYLEIARLLRERPWTAGVTAIGFEADAAVGNDFAGSADISVVAQPAEAGTMHHVPRCGQRSQRQRHRAQRDSSRHQVPGSRMPAMVTRTARAGSPPSGSSGSVLN